MGNFLTGLYILFAVGIVIAGLVYITDKAASCKDDEVLVRGAVGFVCVKGH